MKKINPQVQTAHLEYKKAKLNAKTAKLKLKVAIQEAKMQPKFEYLQSSIQNIKTTQK